jgi:hypothetical protein
VEEYRWGGEVDGMKGWRKGWGEEFRDETYHIPYLK